MSSGYRVAPLFLIRMAGVPFEAVAGLATPETFVTARRLIVAEKARAFAAAELEKIFLSGERPFSEEAYRSLRAALRTNKPPREVAGDQPEAFVRYAQIASETEALQKNLESTLDRETIEARRHLLDASGKFLPRYLVFGSAGVRSIFARAIAARGELGQRDRTMRKREQTLLMYLQRVATKNDTFSEFGPSAWGRILPQNAALKIDPVPGVQSREAYLERWTAHVVAEVVNTDLAAIGADVPRLRVPALNPHACEALAEDVEKWPDGAARSKWLPHFKALAAFPEMFLAAESPNDRQMILDQTEALLASMGAHRGKGDRFLYSALNPIGEECVRESGFSVSESAAAEVTTQAAAWIDLWRDCYAFVASRVSIGLRKILEGISSEGAPVPLPVFLQTCAAARLALEGPGLVAPAVLAFQEVKAAVAGRLRPHLAKDVYDLTDDDCHVIRNSFQYPRFDEYTYPSADIQISAASAGAVADGDYQWVVSELHPPVALLHHGVYWGCPDHAELNRAFARSVFGRPNFHFGFVAADFTSHTAVRVFDALPDLSFFVAPQRPDPRWQTVLPADAEVFVEPASGDVGVRNSKTGDFLGSFARAWVIPLGFHPFQFAVPPHTPRLRRGNLIVQRRSWTVELEELQISDVRGISKELVVAVERLRASKDWPRYVYMRPTERALRRSGAEGRDKDTKPVFVDLESYLFIEIFHRWLVKAGELEVTEMLPVPDQLPWHEKDGHHTFEMRTLIVPA